MKPEHRRMRQEQMFEELYIDYFNNFLTIGRFAEWYSMSENTANKVINTGRKINHRR